MKIKVDCLYSTNYILEIYRIFIVEHYSNIIGLLR